jgi:hypothetical protein
MLPPIFQWLKASSDVTNIIGNAPTKAYRHGEAPQNTVAPYLTWQVISGTPHNELSAVPDGDRYSIQVDCMHSTDLGIEQLAKAVRDAIEPHAHMVAMPINNRDAETKLYRISLQFDVLQNR